MKKIALVLALIASMQIADAQVKSPSAAKAAAEKAQADAANPKKNTKVATWIKLGQAYIDAYSAPAGNAWVGAGKQELALVMGSKPAKSEVVEVNGQQMTKDTYENCNLYFSANEVLQIIEVTKPVYADALDKAYKAFQEAAKVDEKGSKTADIANALKDISGKLVQDAYNEYTFGNMKAASEYFEKAAVVSATKPCTAIDTNSFYNAGFTAQIAGDNDRAKKMYDICLDKYNYEGEGGEIYAKLADLCDKADDKEGMKNYLEKGFARFPQSQSILIGLINYYISSGEDTGRLFELIDEAKKNEPNNASLWYVEGNINTQLGKIEDAVAAYEKCAQINPEYEYGFIGEGILYYNKAIELQEKAQSEMDDAKYQKLAEEFEAALKNCIAPFEKAFNLSKDDALKVNVAEYLKNATYRFRDEDANFKAAYEKYADIVAKGTAK